MKDFDAWSLRKMEINNKMRGRFYKERDVWWCSLGLNIGSEQDGKDAGFQRPILVLKSFGPNICLAIPLTTSERESLFRFSLGNVKNRQSKALISQIRVIDTRRLINKIGVIELDVFSELKKTIKGLL